MNARPKLTIADALFGESLPVLRQRLAATVARYGNDDCATREGALEALIDGRAAFWSDARYSDQIACSVLCEVNAGRPIIDAIDHRKWHPLWSQFRERILDGLVPLNPSATAALLAAYSVVGAWREADELEARRGLVGEAA